MRTKDVWLKFSLLVRNLFLSNCLKNVVQKLTQLEESQLYNSIFEFLYPEFMNPFEFMWYEVMPFSTIVILQSSGIQESKF